MDPGGVDPGTDRDALLPVVAPAPVPGARTSPIFADPFFRGVARLGIQVADALACAHVPDFASVDRMVDFFPWTASMIRAAVARHQPVRRRTFYGRQGGGTSV
jgi:hypothetical protein